MKKKKNEEARNEKKDAQSGSSFRVFERARLSGGRGDSATRNFSGDEGPRAVALSLPLSPFSAESLSLSARVSAFRFALKRARFHGRMPTCLSSLSKTSYLVYCDTLAACTSS